MVDLITPSPPNDVTSPIIILIPPLLPLYSRIINQYVKSRGKMITQKNHPANHPSKNPLRNLGLKGPNLENQIFYQKLGPVTLLVLPLSLIHI